ncbi:MAG TPA: hypothetical protein VGC41_11535, partial [Kofleriaceae bacterium]
MAIKARFVGSDSEPGQNGDVMSGQVSDWIARIDALAFRAERERDFNVSTMTPGLFQDARTQAIAMERSDREVFLEAVGTGLRSLAETASGYRAEILRSFAKVFSTAAKGRARR